MKINKFKNEFTEEDEKALNEFIDILNDAPVAKPPPELDRRIMAIAHDEFAKRRQKSVLRFVPQVISWAAIFIFVAAVTTLLLNNNSQDQTAIDEGQTPVQIQPVSVTTMKVQDVVGDSADELVNPTFIATEEMIQKLEMNIFFESDEIFNENS